MPKYDLHFDPPVMNAAGFLGFTPDPRGPVDLKQMGAFVTNPLSAQERTPAAGTRIIPFPGGFLLHIGHPNEGLRQVVKSSLARWRRSPLPVIVHLLGENPDQMKKAVQMLESRDGVAALEIGLPPEIDVQGAARLAAAAQGELPIIVRIPVERAVEFAGGLAGVGAAAFSLAPARGCLKDGDGYFVSGRLYGPSQLPLTLAVVRSLSQGSIPVIAAGGIYSADDVGTALRAGAAAVQLDGVLWRDGVQSDYSPP